MRDEVAVVGEIITRLSQAQSSSCSRANPSLRACQRSAALGMGAPDCPWVLPALVVLLSKEDEEAR